MDVLEEFLEERNIAREDIERMKINKVHVVVTLEI